MSTTIDDIYKEQYEQEQFHSQEIEDGVQKFIRKGYSEQAESLFSNLSNSEVANFYKKHLLKSINFELWEYGVTVIWKTVILFCYEKLFQINMLGFTDKKFKDSLESKKRDCVNPFSFNCFEDRYIGDNLMYVWRNLDINYQNMFLALLYERNSLSHVNEYPYSVKQFGAYLEKAVNLLEYLQNLHTTRLDQVVGYIGKNGNFKYLSNLEIDMLVENHLDKEFILSFLSKSISTKEISDKNISLMKDKSVDLFLDSKSFDTAKRRGDDLIMPLSPNFSKLDFTKLLNKIPDNGQILFSGGMEEVCVKLYVESINNFSSINDDWKEFLEKVKAKDASTQFPNLITMVED